MGDRIAWHDHRVGNGHRTSMDPPRSGSRSRIVGGVDGSVSSIAAVRWAAHHCEIAGAQLQAVISWGVRSGAVAGPVCGAVAQAEDARATIRVALDHALCAGAAAVELRVMQGRPEEVLLRAAAGPHLLVVGCRERAPQGRFVAGSVGAYVVAWSSCPVAIVRCAHAGLQPHQPDDSSPLVSWQYTVWPGQR